MGDLSIERATEFLVRLKWNDEAERRSIFITRYNNHGGWIEDGGWVVCLPLGPMNPWYLGADGLWRYKTGIRFATAQVAYDAACHSSSPTASAVAARD